MQGLKTLKMVWAALLVAGLAACGGGGGSSGAVGSGSLRLALTDAPSCGYDEVNVTIEKIRVHTSSTAGTGDSGWSEVVLSSTQRVNLLDLTNGVLAELGQTALPAGHYSQLRLVLAANDATHPLRNSVLPTGGTEVPLKTPSGQQSGLKTAINIDIAANQLADFVLDFDACKSIVVAGASGQYLLKPVLSVIPRYVSGVAGFVDATLVNGTSGVSLQQGGVVVKATVPATDGSFLLQPVAPGNYTLVLTAAGRTTLIVTEVVVTADLVTSLNAAGTAFNPPASASGTLDGLAPLDTLVRVLQPLTGGPTVELTGRVVDADSGAYSYTVPTEAPLVAPYVALPGSLVFTPDAAAAGLYTMRASLSGFTDKDVVLAPLTADATLTTNFSFL